MKKTDKLKVVFDFIADYLNEDNEKPKKVKKKKNKKDKELTTKELITEGDVVTKDEDNLKRAYEIMKKIEEYESRGQSIGRDSIHRAIVDGSFSNADMSVYRDSSKNVKKLKNEFVDDKLKQLKRFLDSSKDLDNRISEKEKEENSKLTKRMGLTLDENGKIINVKCKELTESRGEIEKHIKEIESETKNK